MNTILRYVLCFLLLGNLISCDKEKVDNPNQIRTIDNPNVAIKKPNKDIYKPTDEPSSPENEPPRHKILYRYSVNENIKDSAFIEVLIDGYGVVTEKGYWDRNSELRQIYYSRVGQSNRTIEGIKAYLKEHPKEDLSKLTTRIPVKDFKNSELILDQTKSNFIAKDILSVKMSKEEDCLLLTLKTPLREEDSSPVTYKLKYVKKAKVKK